MKSAARDSMPPNMMLELLQKCQEIAGDGSLVVLAIDDGTRAGSGLLAPSQIQGRSPAEICMMLGQALSAIRRAAVAVAEATEIPTEQFWTGVVMTGIHFATDRESTHAITRVHAERRDKPQEPKS